jgi:hypothetical protein
VPEWKDDVKCFLKKLRVYEEKIAGEKQGRSGV